jgi:hypothetical protein
MMQLGWIVNPDHMSQAAVDETLSILEAGRYSGVISPHGWVDPGNWPRLWKLGGMAFPGHSGTDTYVKEWQQYRPRETPYAFGWGYGADLGGLSHQPDKSAEGAISYPFKSYDGTVTFERQRTGERTFDFTKEGVSHYGLYADWLEDLRRVGGQSMADDMWKGAEAYLQMWERASGIVNPRCYAREQGFRRAGRGPLALGDDWVTLLRKAGQPQRRDRTWTWCVKGKRNATAADVALLSQDGRVEVVGSNADGRWVPGVSTGKRGGVIGAPVNRIKRGRRLGGGLIAQRAGRSTFVFATRARRVRAIAVMPAALARDRRAMREAMGKIVAAKASSAPRRFVPAEPKADQAMLGRALASSGDRDVDAKLALYSSLNL